MNRGIQGFLLALCFSSIVNRNPACCKVGVRTVSQECMESIDWVREEVVPNSPSCVSAKLGEERLQGMNPLGVYQCGQLVLSPCMSADIPPAIAYGHVTKSGLTAIAPLSSARPAIHVLDTCVHVVDQMRSSITYEWERKLGFSEALDLTLKRDNSPLRDLQSFIGV